MSHLIQNLQWGLVLPKNQFPASEKGWFRFFESSYKPTFCCLWKSACLVVPNGNLSSRNCRKRDIDMIPFDNQTWFPSKNCLYFFTQGLYSQISYCGSFLNEFVWRIILCIGNVFGWKSRKTQRSLVFLKRKSPRIQSTWLHFLHQSIYRPFLLVNSYLILKFRKLFLAAKNLQYIVAPLFSQFRFL